jgi:hypothetical protein
MFDSTNIILRFSWFDRSLPKQCHRFSSSTLLDADQFGIASLGSGCLHPIRILIYFESICRKIDRISELTLLILVSDLILLRLNTIDSLLASLSLLFDRNASHVTSNS